MFGLGKNDKDQRFWNLMLFKVYATDKEIEDMAPYAVAMIIIIIILVWVFS